MGQESKVLLIGYHERNTELCASAARISTTKGSAAEIFEKSKGNEKNQELIRRVLRSGHKTIIEHAAFTFAFQNVSAFAEQYFIESRLASFTVKSRRYVDFGGQGYYVPPDLEGGDKEAYCEYMDALFAAYGALLENGIPKEDARFLLPYSFHSNFYCTLNARELVHILRDIKYGRGRDIPELQELAALMAAQVREVFPGICDEIEAVPAGDGPGTCAPGVFVCDQALFMEPQQLGSVRLLAGPAEPAEILRAAYRIYHPGEDQVPPFCSMLRTGRPRELEQLSYSFVISDITLSGITHMVRHRMQSVLVPSIRELTHGKYVLPDTIRRDGASCSLYKHALECSHERVKRLCKDKTLGRFGYYFAVSGNVMDLMTTQNARELDHFMRLRTCNRAQWEIRKIAVDMLKSLRGSFPELFSCFGPGCFVNGQCPEGSMSCGKKDEVLNFFLHM